MKAPRILVLDDEPDVLALISTALKAEGFDVVTTSSIAEFWRRNAEGAADFYIVDITLPDGSGFNVVKELRRHSDCGILVVSGRSSETDHVVGLEIGADDYVTKPFRMRELAARVSAIYRRSSLVPSGQRRPDMESVTPDPPIDFAFGDYRLSLTARRLWGAGMEEIELTTAEFDLLATFAARPNRVLTREQIMNSIKGREWESYDRAVDGLVSRLRKKIPPQVAHSQYIRTVHGFGYLFTA